MTTYSLHVISLGFMCPFQPVSWPEVNGVVLNYSATCRSDLDSSQWTCGSIDASRRSCILTVSDDPCHCSLTVTNSAGTSPPAHISIPAHTHAGKSLKGCFTVFGIVRGIHVQLITTFEMVSSWTWILIRSRVICLSGPMATLMNHD